MLSYFDKRNAQKNLVKKNDFLSKATKCKSSDRPPDEFSRWENGRHAVLSLIHRCAGHAILHPLKPGVQNRSAGPDEKIDQSSCFCGYRE